MKFVGIDLTSAFAAARRPIDVAVLDDARNATFLKLEWPPGDVVIRRDSSFLARILRDEVPLGPGEAIVLAVDGPQGLANRGNAMRECERLLGTPGRTPSGLPAAEEAGVPFQGYIRSSVDLFAGLVAAAPPWALARLNGVIDAQATLWEVFPGAEWTALAGRRLASKASSAGRQERRSLLAAAGIAFTTQALPFPDQNDALVGAYLVWCVHHRPASIRAVGVAPFEADGEIREGVILHAAESVGINLPVSDSAAAPDEPEDPNGWNEDGSYLLKLTDYGVVHGTEPENAWLIAGRDYVLQTVPPQVSLMIELTHASSFAGGQAWRAAPTIRQVLAQLGLVAPQNLTRQNAVTLQVVVA